MPRKLGLIVAMLGLLAGLWAVPTASASATKRAVVRIQWVTIRGAHNKPDPIVMRSDGTSRYGSVPYVYRIGKYDVTTAQYAAFLNAVASKSDPHLLYYPCMDDKACYGLGSGIAKRGTLGHSRYVVEPGRALMPINYINLFTAMRFANWVNNGEGQASTETGAYTLAGVGPIPTNAATITRNQGAKVFLPDENEWFKAAYYDVRHKRYFLYPGGTNTAMKCALPGSTPNTANCGAVTGVAASHGLPMGAWIFNYLTKVGAYKHSAGPNGTFDQGGDVYQWTDTLTDAVTNQYMIGAQTGLESLLKRLQPLTGAPFVNGVGPLAVLGGVDFGDAQAYLAADNRSVDVSADIFETYGFRLAARK